VDKSGIMRAKERNNRPGLSWNTLKMVVGLSKGFSDSS